MIFPPHDFLLEMKNLKCFLHMTAISGGLEAIFNPFKPILASLSKGGSETCFFPVYCSFCFYNFKSLKAVFFLITETCFSCLLFTSK